MSIITIDAANVAARSSGVLAVSSVRLSAHLFQHAALPVKNLAYAGFAPFGVHATLGAVALTV